MYRCPECGENNVKIIRNVTMIEYWTGDDVETEESLDERAPEKAEIECLECGHEDCYLGCLDEWWEDD